MALSRENLEYIEEIFLEVLAERTRKHFGYYETRISKPHLYISHHLGDTLIFAETYGGNPRRIRGEVVSIETPI